MIDATDGNAARATLENAGIEVLGVRETVTVRLAQNEPGQLGKLCGAMADAGVNIEALYSDHTGSLILVVDRPGAARDVARSWMAGRTR